MPKKSRMVAILLCLFLGGVGFHKFYLNRNVAGILYLVFFWTFIPAMIAIVDFFVLLLTPDQKFNSIYNKK